jgi:hypothetical protein
MKFDHEYLTQRIMIPVDSNPNGMHIDQLTMHFLASLNDKKPKRNLNYLTKENKFMENKKVEMASEYGVSPPNFNEQLKAEMASRNQPGIFGAHSLGTERPHSVQMAEKDGLIKHQ